MTLKFNSGGQWITPAPESLNKTLPKGADVAKEALEKGEVPVLKASVQYVEKGDKLPILDGSAPPQPTDEQLFGHLVVTEEQAQAYQKTWENRLDDWFKDASAPIDHLNKSSVADRKWGNGKSFNDLLNEEELKKRQMHVGE